MNPNLMTLPSSVHQTPPSIVDLYDRNNLIELDKVEAVSMEAPDSFGIATGMVGLRKTCRCMSNFSNFLGSISFGRVYRSSYSVVSHVLILV